MTPQQRVLPEAEPDAAAARSHLDWLFGPALADPEAPARIVLSTIVAKQYEGSQEFAEIEAAAAWGVACAVGANVYTHIALHCPKGPERLHMRGTTDSAVCLTVLAADLDADNVYRSSHVGRAPNVASLWELIADFEQAYQHRLTVIESGYGLYACSRFREPLWLPDQAAREDAGQMLKRFAEAFRILASKRGWPSTVDTVGLAGVLRLGGTLNRKGSAPVAVALCARNGASRE